MMQRTLLSFCAGLTVSAALGAQCVAHSTPMASGCGFSTPFGVPVAQCSGAPTIGNAAFGFTSSTQCVGTPLVSALLVGTCVPSPAVILNPSSGLCLSQAICSLHVNAIVLVPGLLQGGAFHYATPIPNVPQLVGLQLCVQAAHTCSGLSCIMATNAVRVTLQ